MNVLVVGDALVDIHVKPTGEIAFGTDTLASTSISPGGAGANIAAWLSAVGTHTHLLGCIGLDPFGAFLSEACQRIGIHAHWQTTHESPTGTCVVLIDQTGERSMLPDAGANRSLTMPPGDTFTGIDHIHLSGYTLAHPIGPALVELLAQSSSSTSLDLASTAIITPTSPIQRAAHLVDVVFGTEAEFAELDRVPERALLITKCGDRGVRATAAEEQWEVAAPSVPVVSTTGAGDAFAAGFLASWLNDRSDITAALDAGTQLAGHALRRVAAWPNLPDQEE